MMNYFTKGELTQQGYHFSLSYNFCANAGKTAQQTLFSMQGIQKLATPIDWVELMIEKSRVLGFPEIPHTVIHQGKTSHVSFHFKNDLDCALFNMVADGFRQEKYGFQAPIIVPPDQSVEKMDVYIDAVSAACERLGILCKFQHVDDFKTNVYFSSNADFALYVSEIPEIVADINRRWDKAKDNLLVAGYSAGLDTSRSEFCVQAQSVIEKAKQFRPT